MWWKVLRDRLRALLDNEAVHREIDEELRFHLDMKTEENISKGMSPDEARRSAEARFGRVTRIKELGYSVRGGGLIETLWQDLRYAIRMLRHDAAFTFVAVLTLALGIRMNTAMFSIVNTVLLQPLPFANASELVTIYNTSGGESKFPFSPIAFLNLRRKRSGYKGIKFQPICFHCSVSRLDRVGHSSKMRIVSAEITLSYSATRYGRGGSEVTHNSSDKRSH